MDDGNISTKQRSQSAFTLIELSIVMVIIGLLAGGVLVGRDLIAGAAIRAQVTQFEKFNSAVNAFRDKYGCLAGDCINATSFLTNAANYNCGSYHPCGNGNGDGAISDFTGAVDPTSIAVEPLQFGAHLYLAGLTDCCAMTNPYPYQIGLGFPQDKVNGFGISIVNSNGANLFFWGITNSTNATGSYGGNNPDGYGALTYPSNTIGVLSTAQAQAFDRKIDDGLPTTGRVVAAWLYGGDDRLHTYVYRGGQYCIAANGTYDLSQTGNGCSFFILVQ